MHIKEWLLSQESRTLDFEALITQLTEKLITAGVPLWYVSTSLRTLHPEVFVKNIQWAQKNGTQSFLRSRQILESSGYKQSPVYHLYQMKADEIRIDLTQKELPFHSCYSLAEKGGTDYFIVALDYSNGQRGFISFATNSPDGFSVKNYETLKELTPVLALRNELAAQKFATDCLLRVYLGGQASQKVLGGQFLRGQSKTLNAAIWFSDMRSFTDLSNRVSEQRLIQILDLYFDTLVNPIHAHGGEVLKFIGDAILAVFPTDVNPKKTCLSALSAAKEALQALHKLKVPEAPELAAGIGLHLGDITFGNVGSAERLDFTVIGSRVNEASRIEGLCKSLKEPLLVSENFAEAIGKKNLRSLGKHHLRGVTTPMEIFGA